MLGCQLSIELMDFLNNADGRTWVGVEMLSHLKIDFELLISGVPVQLLILTLILSLSLEEDTEDQKHLLMVKLAGLRI